MLGAVYTSRLRSTFVYYRFDSKRKWLSCLISWTNGNTVYNHAPPSCTQGYSRRYKFKSPCKLILISRGFKREVQRPLDLRVLHLSIFEIYKKMREIVHIQAGQCGNQIGAKVIITFPSFPNVFRLYMKYWRKRPV